MSRLTSLLEWFATHGIKHDSEAIEICADASQYSGDAWGVFAKRNIAEGAILVTIPKAAVLSTRTSSLSGWLDEHQVGGGLGLVLAVMHEHALGPRSPWHGYLQSLPVREYIPLFWSPEELELLVGTDAEQKAAEDREDTAADYETEVEPLLSRGGGLFDPAKMTLESFRRAAAWIGSRAFGVDDHHGMAMVPFADIFNHKAAVVALGGDFQLAGACLAGGGGFGSGEDSDEEPAGSESSSEAAEQDSGSAGDGEAGSGSEEGGDAAGGGAEPRTRGSLLHARLFPGRDLRLHIGICSETRGGQEVLEIVAACDLAAGREVFNTFGELSGSELLCKYGFALPGNPFDAVRLPADDLIAETGRLLGEAACRQRCRYLQRTSDLLDGEAEGLELLRCGQVGPPLLVAARLVSCSGAELRAVERLDLDGAIVRLLPPDAAEDGGGTPAKRRKLAEQEAGDGGGQPQEEAAATQRNAVIAERPAWFPPDACRLLLACVGRRAARHAHKGSAAALQAELARAHRELPGGEARAARLGALQLLLAEKEVLAQAQAALEGLLAAHG